MHVPIVARGGQQVGDAVASRFLFAAREQHVNAVEIGLGRCGIELERLVEGAPRVHHVNLPAETVARVLQFGNAQPGPSRGKCRVGRGHAREQRMRAIQIGARARAHHERAQERTRLQIFFAHRPGERSVARRSSRRCGSRARLPRFNAFGCAHALEGGEDFNGNLGLHRDQIERRHANRSARAYALRGHVEQLPVQIEAAFRAHEVSREHKLDQQLLPHGQRIELRDGQLHERA